MDAAAGMPFQVFLLHRFEVRRGDSLIRAQDWPRRKAAMLLQRLALHGHLHRDQALDFLWPDQAPETAANNLYRTLHALRT